jgi:hypothetical protein
MAIFAGIGGVLGRFAGKFLTTTLGWASTLLFGRVPQDRQVVLALITFGSIIWVALALGVVLPYVGAFLVAAVPAPGLIAESWLRLAMLVGALVVPAIVGIATIFVVEPAKRPRASAMPAQILRGYPLSVALALTLILLGLVGIARFLHHLAHRWSDSHIAIVIRPGGYERVVADVERALDDAGLEVTPRPAPALLAVPGQMLGTIAGPGIRSLVPDNLIQLVGPGIEVGLYPSDIAISGNKVIVARARAAVASRLLATAAWMTTTAEAQEIEARLERLTASRVPGGTPGGRAGDTEAQLAAAAELRSIDEALAILVVPHDEWEVLYRERLQVERDMLAGARTGAAFPGAGDDNRAPGVIAGRVTAEPDPLPHWLPAAVAAAGLVATVADVVLALLDRRRER